MFRRGVLLCIVACSNGSSRLLHMAMQTVQPVVLCGPSGSGKSTLVKKLMNNYPHCFAFSVSHTTRKPRPGERDGTDYFFVSREQMQNKIVAQQFLEHAEFSGNMYGTSIAAVEEVQRTGRICILDVDVQGVKNIKKTNLNPRYIFISPPSKQALEERLRGRGTETDESLRKRLHRAQVELDYGAVEGNFHHSIVNDDLEMAYGQLRSILMQDLEAMQANNGT